MKKYKGIKTVILYGHLNYADAVVEVDAENLEEATKLIEKRFYENGPHRIENVDYDVEDREYGEDLIVKEVAKDE